MTTAAVLSPNAKQQFLNNNGQPNSSGLLYTYQAGTTTPAATYTDSTASSQNTNPIVLNARGECNLWLLPNVAYKLTLTDSAGNSIWTVDQVVNSQLLTLYGGVDTGAANAYILTFASSFSSLTDGIVIYWVPANNNTGASTIDVNGLGTVNIVNLNGAALGANQILANQMTEIIYKGGEFQLLSVGNLTGAIVGTFGPESAIASAITTDLGSATAHVVNVTGTTTITSFGSSASTVAPIYCVRFTGSLLLTYNATSLILPGAQNIQTQAGDACVAQYLGSGNWTVLLYQIAQSTGTFTGTLTGMTTTVTATFNWVRVGNLVTVYTVLGATGTSNSSSMTLTGIPAAIVPVNTTLIPVGGITTSLGLSAGYVRTSNSGVFTFYYLYIGVASASEPILISDSFATSGNKGLDGAASFTYPLQ